MLTKGVPFVWPLEKHKDQSVLQVPLLEWNSQYVNINNSASKSDNAESLLVKKL